MRIRIFYHIAFWVAYVLFKTYLNLNYSSRNLTQEELAAVIFQTASIQVLFLLIKLPMVYGLFRILNYLLTGKISIFKTICYSLAILLVADIALILFDDHVIKFYYFGTVLPWTFGIGSIISVFFLLSFTACLAVAIKLVRHSLSQKEKEATIIRQKLETELKYLRAQTNPHFLFNTLNNIYALARKKSDDTADVVMKLSKLLRFMLYESQREKITLAQEIQVIEDYIQLEKIRYSGQLNLNYKKEISNSTLNIAPLILLPFVENAFKHGVSESRFESSIEINLIEQDGQIIFYVANTFSPHEVPEDKEIKTIGLENIKRQLSLLYPQHKLDIFTDQHWYKVNLKLDIN